METDQHDVSNVSEGTTNEGGSLFVSGDVSVEGSSDSNAKEKRPAYPQTDNHIYRQDVVRRTDEGLLGVVTEVAGDSDSDSDSESDFTDDDDDDGDDDNEEAGKEEEEGVKEKEKGGNVDKEGDNKGENGEADDSDNDERGRLIADQVRVLWMDDSETTHHRSELKVLDRNFVHGDYVASALDPTGQIGLVVDVNIIVDLFAPDGSFVKSVSSRDLKRVRNITVGDYVVSGPWLGRVDDVLDDVTILFNDGSVCKIHGAEPSQLIPVDNNLLEDGHCPYHPGQRVRASSNSVLKEGKWLSGRWKINRLEATVMKVTVGSVYVHWIASAGYGPDSSISPAEEQNPKKLKLLSCFTHANWQLGDWCFLPSISLSPSIPLESPLSKLRIQEESDEQVESIDPDGVGTSDCVDGML